MRFYNLFLFATLSVFTLCLNAQDSLRSEGLFEGKVIYQYQILNPNPALISDEEFYSSIPNRGKSEVVFYVKGNRYRWEYPERVEIYNPSGSQLVSIPKSTKDSVGFLNVALDEDSILKIDKWEWSETIMGHHCQSLSVKSKWETRVYFYNPSILKSNSQFWRNHKRDFWNHYFSRAASFPLRIRRKSMLGNYEMTAVQIERKKLEDNLFQY